VVDLHPHERDEDVFERRFGFFYDVSAACLDFCAHAIGLSIADNGPILSVAFTPEDTLNGGWRGLWLIETHYHTSMIFEDLTEFIAKNDFPTMNHAYMITDALDFV